MNDVVADDFKAGVGKKMSDVAFRAGEEIVQTEDFGARTDQAVTQVASQEACSAGDHNSFRRHADHPDGEDAVRVSAPGARFVWLRGEECITSTIHRRLVPVCWESG